ncbi:MAG: 3-dehydroquinate synthase, partial [Eubacteriales bacterium]|nr:3-dehydroquinate synthase [Eubacteriales bacterium]
MINILNIKAGTGEYNVYIEQGSITSIPARLKDAYPKSRFALITDDNVYGLYGQTVLKAFDDARLGHDVIRVAPGERSKSIGVFADIMSALAQKNYNRADVVVALGGGIVGDLAGFAAASYLRGVRYVQIPTTLLAQIDSAVGGKTAVNIPEGKNLVGAFYQPGAVYIDTDFLKTLKPQDFADGMAEMIKYALIRDGDMFDSLEKMDSVGAGSSVLGGFIIRCLEIKRDVVAADEKDKAERMILNFGHTIGHGLERMGAAGGRAVTHGQGVARGMAAIAAAGERMGQTKAGTAARIVQVLEKAGLPHSIDGFDKQEILKGIFVDKKNVADTLSIILISEPGGAFIHKIKK